MALYSVFRWDTGLFDVYQDGKSQGLDRDPVIAPKFTSEIGVPVETVLGSVPFGARRIQSSRFPVGQVVASRGLGLGLGDLPRYAVPLLGGLLVVVAAASLLARR
jgi:hypothetical protein